MKKHKALKIVLIVLAVLIVAGGVGGWLFYKNMMSKMGQILNSDQARVDNRVFEEDDCDQRDDTFIPPPPPVPIVNTEGIESVFSSDILNILLIGSDARHLGEQARSDTMIVCSINKATNEIKLVSFMRDTLAKIRASELKLNAAYFYGGAELLDQTLERNFGVVVDANVAVNFESFIAGIAQIGNLEIELYQEEADWLNTTEASSYEWHLTAGVNTMDPEQVLAYARTRYVGNSDWERTSRQRRVIMAAFQKVKQLSLSQLLSLADRILPCIATDLSTKQIFDLAKYVLLNDVQITGELLIPVDGHGDTVNGQSVLLCNYSRNSREFRQFIYGY